MAGIIWKYLYYAHLRKYEDMINNDKNLKNKGNELKNNNNNR